VVQNKIEVFAILIMSFACIYLPKNKKFVSVKTKLIRDFDNARYTCEEQSTRTKKVYIVCRPNLPPEKCQVMLLADSKADIEKMMATKRISIPKLSRSIIDEPILDDNMEIIRPEKKRKKMKKNIEKAKQETSKKILQTYLQKDNLMSTSGNECETSSSISQFTTRHDIPVYKINLKNNTNNCIDDEISDENVSTDETKRDSVKLQPTRSEKKLHTKFLQSDSDIEYHEQQQIKSLQYEVQCKTRELKVAEEQVEYYRKKYENLKNSEAFPLTEKTGQEILRLVAEKGLILYKKNVSQYKYI